MPLRQFRARARGPTILNHGQQIVRDRGFRVPPPNFGPAAPSSVASTRAVIPMKSSRRAMNSATATSFAALSTVGAAAPGLERYPGESQGREARRVRLFEAQGRGAGEVEPRRRPHHALGPSQAICDRDAHVRASQLGDERAVAEFDQAMHDRLRMDQDVDLLGWQRQTDGALRSAPGPCSSGSPN